MIKLIIFRCISAVSWKVLNLAEDTMHWADDKIVDIDNQYKPAKTWMWAIDILTFILMIALSIAVIVYLSYNPKIQDIKPVEKKVEIVVEDSEFRNNSAVFFSWLDDEVYNIIIDKCKKRNIDPSLFM